MHDFADWLEKRLPHDAGLEADGEANYNYMLQHILLLPMDARDVAHLGEVELARYRALEAMLPDPSLADPDPARAKSIPADQQAFLAAYESREQEMIDFLKREEPGHAPAVPRAVPDPPAARGVQADQPGRLHESAGHLRQATTAASTSSRPTTRRATTSTSAPRSKIPRPILGHEGIPGHFLQLSIANHLTDEIRRHHGDSVFVEGWALYGEEMLMREGLYPENSAGAGAGAAPLAYRAARIGVDVNLHTGKWTFEQGVNYFMEGGGSITKRRKGRRPARRRRRRRRSATSPASGRSCGCSAATATQQGAAFRLGQFHDRLISYGSLPLSVVEWLMFEDSTAVRATSAR